jgi:hypothetical protein
VRGALTGAEAVEFRLADFLKTGTPAGDNSAVSPIFLLFSRTAVLGVRHPGSMRASGGRLKPPDWSRERRLRAGF